MDIPWEEGQEEGPRASESIFLNMAPSVLSNFLFSVRKFSYSCCPKHLSVEVIRTLCRNVFQIKIYYYPDFSNLRMETKSEMTR